MLKWKWEPTVSIGNLFFGMERSSIRQLYNDNYTEYKKTPKSENTTDDFGKFHAYYSKDDRLEAVEIFDGIEVDYQNRCIFPAPITSVLAQIPEMTEDFGSYFQSDLSIAVGVQDGRTESMLFGCKGYYE